MSSSSKSTQYTQNDLEKLKERAGGSFDSFDSLLKSAQSEKTGNSQFEKKPSFGRQRVEFTIFTHLKHTEKDVIPREIAQLKEEIRREIKALKQANKALLAEAEEIEKASMTTLPEKSGVYQVKFLEFLLSLLSTLRTKVSEAKSWMSALQSKKAKRGSLFAARSKKKGTQYSQSQELQNARSIQ